MTDTERLEVRRQAFAEAVQVVKDHRARWAVKPIGAGAMKVLDNVMSIERELTRLQEEAALDARP